jgi:hypothetical protein
MGGLSASAFDPATAMKTPAPTVISSAISQEGRPVTAEAKRSHTAIPIDYSP